ncbi:MAG: YHS domain-containing (seleno)protein [Pseudomonadota bacterium]
MTSITIHRSRRLPFTAVILSFVLATFSASAFADKDPVYTGVFSSTALSGYDTVAYFTDGKPVKGSKKFSTKHNGAKWLFASAANRDAFVANPEKYAPQYGGYCAWAVSQGYTASGDPTVWAIVDDKLYVNYNDDVGATWRKDPVGFIKLADTNWPNVLK